MIVSMRPDCVVICYLVLEAVKTELCRLLRTEQDGLELQSKAT